MIGGVPSPERLRAMSRDEILVIQGKKLAAMAQHLGEHNGFYQDKFAESGVSAADLRSAEDLARLAPTTKADLVADQLAHPPYGRIHTYPVDRYVRLHQTSGTSGGQRLSWLDTPESWEWFTGLWRIIFSAGGVRSGDRFFFPFSFGPFLGFWAGFDAAVRLGYLTMPGGAMNTEARLRFMLDNRATIVCGTPTYMLHLAEVAKVEGLDLAASSVRKLIVAGEPGGNIPETRRRMEKAWGAGVLDHAGMTEIGSLAFEDENDPGGMYLMETECIAQVVDPETMRPLEPGEQGELILTNLGRWGSPLIRYRTGDLVCEDPKPSTVGWNLVRLKGGILGRVDDMVIIRGNNLYPSAIESVLRGFSEITEYRAEVAMREGLAVLTLTIEIEGELGSNGRSLSEVIGDAVREALNFRPEIKMVEAGTLPRFDLKAQRFIIDSSYRKERGQDA